ncbi:MAG: hypothetical protein RL069_1574, partial [Planctomycetota bacterium]
RDETPRNPPEARLPVDPNSIPRVEYQNGIRSRAIHSFTLGKMPRNQTVFISLKKLKKPQKTLAENSDVSVFPNVRAQLWSELKHRGSEARSYSARWMSLREEDRVTENEVANWTDASLFALLS